MNFSGQYKNDLFVFFELFNLIILFLTPFCHCCLKFHVNYLENN